MGMDLYKYKLIKETGNGSIWLYNTKQADELLKDLDVEYELGYKYNIEKLTKDLTNLTFNFKDFIWDLESDKKYICRLSDEIIDKLDSLFEESRRLYETDYDKFLEVDYEQDVLLEKISNNAEEYSDKFLYLSDEDLKPYITEEYYVIKNTKVEIGYLRKPFRYSSTPSKRTVDKNGDTTVTCFIDNTTGVDEELYNEMKKYCYYDEENCQMIFTSNSTRANELLKKCINPKLSGVSELFPIKDNEIIEIDW